VLDAQSQVVVLNAAAAQLLGLNGPETLGQPAQALHQNLQPSIDLRVLLSSAGLDGQAQVKRIDDGRTVSLLIKVKRVTQKGAENFRVIAITDVTDLMAAHDLLQSHHRRWQAINAGVVLVDVNEPDLPIVYVNPAFEEMTGYRAEEVIGRNCRFLQGDVQDQPGLKTIREALMARRNGYAVLRNFRKDGSEFLNELFISPVHDAVGKLTHFLGVQHLRHAAPDVLPFNLTSEHSTPSGAMPLQR
jgi:PAS domain S-box-containing protein